MPFDENKLKGDLTNALGLPVPDGEDAAMETVAEIGAAMSAAIALNPTSTVLENEEKIQTLMDELEALTAKVGELEEFTSNIEQRTSAVESKVNK